MALEIAHCTKRNIQDSLLFATEMEFMRHQNYDSNAKCLACMIGRAPLQLSKFNIKEVPPLHQVNVHS
jgi:hypothetical protein